MNSYVNRNAGIRNVNNKISTMWGNDKKHCFQMKCLVLNFKRFKATKWFHVSISFSLGSFKVKETWGSIFLRKGEIVLRGNKHGQWARYWFLKESPGGRENPQPICCLLKLITITQKNKFVHECSENDCIDWDIQLEIEMSKAI